MTTKNKIIQIVGILLTIMVFTYLTCAAIQREFDTAKWSTTAFSIMMGVFIVSWCLMFVKVIDLVLKEEEFEIENKKK